jgi:soluble calcium-activated nucleotidase 1
MSKEAYDDVADEKRGHNTVLVASENFNSITAFTVGVLTPERGFSSAKFLPNSKDRVIIALKSEENAALGTQTTYVTIFEKQNVRLHYLYNLLAQANVVIAQDGTWQVVFDETELPGEAKFEGIEVLSYYN